MAEDRPRVRNGAETEGRRGLKPGTIVGECRAAMFLVRLALGDGGRRRCTWAQERRDG